ncbi:MAG: hypothetical protein JXR51_12605 [Bacteroidales bacterium]|nr:hypothetical protein [Bacteroidales bacterium]MBN2758010.1 hypothetical protein [Bacteroidales bacterium]
MYFKFASILVIFFTMLFGSCYEKDMYIIDKFGKNSSFNNEQTQIAFFKFIHVAKSAKGIRAFPDGGIPLTLFKKIALYKYDISNNQLVEIINFKNLPKHRDSWIQKITFNSNYLAYSIYPISAWWNKQIQNGEAFKSYWENYSGIFVYSLKDKKNIRLCKNGFNPELSPNEKSLVYFIRDSVKIELWKFSFDDEKKYNEKIIDNIEMYSKIFWLNNDEICFTKLKSWKKYNLKTKQISNTEITNYQILNDIEPKIIDSLTKNITYKQWGFDLKNISPKSKAEFVDDIILLAGNYNYRKAVIQEICNDLSTKEIEKILNNMDKYSDRLDKYKKHNYNLSSENTKKYLKKICDNKNKSNN